MDFIFFRKKERSKKACPIYRWSRFFIPTLRTSNDVRLQAVRTYMKSLGRAVNNRLHGADIGLPHFVGSSMRVAYLNAEVYSFFADIAFCHVLHLLYLFHSVFKVNSGILSDLPDECKGFFAKFSF